MCCQSSFSVLIFSFNIQNFNIWINITAGIRNYLINNHQIFEILCWKYIFCYSNFKRVLYFQRKNKKRNMKFKNIFCKLLMIMILNINLLWQLYEKICSVVQKIDLLIQTHVFSLLMKTLSFIFNDDSCIMILFSVFSVILENFVISLNKTIFTQRCFFLSISLFMIDINNIISIYCISFHWNEVWVTFISKRIFFI